MPYEMAKRPPLQQGIPAFALGAIVALILKKTLDLSYHEILILFKAAYSVCFPVMLVGALIYQHSNRLIERAGLLIMNLSTSILGGICFYLLTSILTKY